MVRSFSARLFSAERLADQSMHAAFSFHVVTVEGDIEIPVRVGLL
jgi:hypothetical protein